jgi:hypothetical protein
MSGARDRASSRLSEQMLTLFARGTELQAQGHDDVDAEGPEAAEFRALDKELNWRVLQWPAHMLSVLDPALDGPMPEYMAHLASGRDWGLSRAWRTALLAALEAR